MISITNGRPCISPVVSKCEAIRRLRVPRSAREVKTFIGGVNYLSMYVPHLHGLLRPLYELTRNNVEFQWTKLHQRAFDDIRALLIKPPILNMPIADGQVKLYSDTSGEAVGGSLWQEIDGEYKLIAYHSKSLPEAAKRYSASELELTGLYTNISAFRNILKQTCFLAVVDHSALVNIIASKNEPATMRMKKLLEKLSDYSFYLSYESGKSLVICDMLSRLCCQSDPEYVVDPIACPITRSQARDQGIEVGTIQENREVIDAMHKRGNPTSQDVGPEPLDVEQSVEPVPELVPELDDAPRLVNVPSDVIEPVVTQQVSDLNETPDVRFDPIPDIGRFNLQNCPVKRTGPQTLTSRELGKKGTRNKLEIPFDSLIPRNQRTPQGEVNGIVQPSDELLLRKPSPLFEDISNGNIVHGHLPKQWEIDKLLEQIKMKCLRDFTIPFKLAEIKRELKLSPYFKDIYEYLLTGMLPGNKRMAKSVLKSAENYILIQDVLFCISANGSEIKLALCVPETQTGYIISSYHDSLMGCHQGISKTYVTIRRKFYIPNLYDRLSAFIRSCAICQQRKVPQARDIEQPYEPRIFQNYEPFSEIHIDIKHMYPSTEGFSYLMVCMCVQTRFLMAFPLRRVDAVSVAEMLLQRVVLLFGVPKKIVTDQGKCFTSQVFMYLLRTLKIQPTIISPENHGSLVVERGIQTLSRLLLSHLEDHGKSWALYIQAACFAYNSFAHTLLGGFSPFELVFLRQPPDFLNLIHLPEDSVPVNYEQYVSTLKTRMRTVGNTLLDLQTKQQVSQAQQHVQTLRKKTTYTLGQLIYFLMPNLSNLQTGTRAFKVHYIGPLRIKAVLDPTHVILEDLTGRTLVGIHHVHRLKPAFVRVSDGVVDNIRSLREKMTEKENSTGMAALAIVDENDNVKGPLDTTKFVLCAQESVVSDQFKTKSFYKENSGFACNVQLSDKQKGKLITRLDKMPIEGSELFVSKSRYKDGERQYLFTCRDGQYAIWIEPSLHPCFGKSSIRHGKGSVLPVQGSVLKYFRKLYK